MQKYFLKYKNVIYKQKNGNYKIQPVERNENIFKNMDFGAIF